MNATNLFPARCWKFLIISMLFLGFSLQSISQAITNYQFRQVPQDKMEEFIKRETTYWSKVAEAAIEKGNLTFWGLFVKVGGFDIPNSPNVLFVNSFDDIDAANQSEMWDASKIFPDVPMEDMETFSMSTVMHSIYLNNTGPAVWKEGTVPADDVRFLNFVFHNSNSPGQLVALENEHWKPFIKAAMDAGQTTQIGWVNAQILSPSLPGMQANSVSIDIHPSLKSALTGGFVDDSNVEFPTEALQKINDMEINRRISYIYRRIQVVNANPPGGE